MGKNPAEKASQKDKPKKADKTTKTESKVEKKQEVKVVEEETLDTKPKKKGATHLLTEKSRSEKSCTIEKCNRSYRAKGYCQFHYKKWRHGEYGLARYKRCKDHGCTHPMVLNRHGYCEDHYQNYYIKGMAQAVAPEKAEKKEEQAAG